MSLVGGKCVSAKYGLEVSIQRFEVAGDTRYVVRGVANDHPCMKLPIHLGAQTFAIRAAAGIKAIIAK